MKWGIGLLIFFGVVGWLFFLSHTPHTPPPPKLTKQALTNAPSLPTNLHPLSKSIFVPYWTMDTQLASSEYDEYLYFALAATENGINTSDDGYKNIPQFVSKVASSKKKLLVVSMVDKVANKDILNDAIAQEKIISQTKEIAQKYGFDGIVLDLEYSGLAFDSVTKSVSSFSRKFATEVKAERGLSFYQTIPGDSVYRAKPYDLSDIGSNADGVLVMAYDFHKAQGNPGPNFPFKRLEDEDYDFQTMAKDFLAKIPANKLTVIFGMFGYDWPVDDKGRSSAQAESLSDNEINQKFSETCVFYTCQSKRDATTKETEITYTDSKGNKHVIWMEDADSAAVKTTYLRRLGIGSIGYWAYGYF